MPKCTRCGRNFIWGQSIYGKWIRKENDGLEHRCFVDPKIGRMEIEDCYCETCLRPMKSIIKKTMCICLDPKIISKKKGIELLKIKVEKEEKKIRTQINQQKKDEELKKCEMCGYIAIKMDNEIICLKDPANHRIPDL